MAANLTIELPRLIGGRHRVDQLVDPIGSVLHADVVVSARELRTGSASAADQLVLRVLVEGNARSLVVQGAPDRFVSYLEQASTARGVRSKLRAAALA